MVFDSTVLKRRRRNVVLREAERSQGITSFEHDTWSEGSICSGCFWNARSRARMKKDQPVEFNILAQLQKEETK
ncbi:hypothetical protein V6N13_096172 [Hibiscus sabdariffa]